MIMNGGFMKNSFAMIAAILMISFLIFPAEAGNVYKNGSLIGKIESNGDVWISVANEVTSDIRMVGLSPWKFEANGIVRINGAIVGKIESNGDVLKNGSIIGRIEPNGDVFKNGMLVGKIEPNGDVLKNGSIIGNAKDVKMEWAAGFFFFFFLNEG
jgi:cytoskeletal protein CcmA (bactofilin family)